MQFIAATVWPKAMRAVCHEMYLHSMILSCYIIERFQNNDCRSCEVTRFWNGITCDNGKRIYDGCNTDAATHGDVEA